MDLFTIGHEEEEEQDNKPVIHPAFIPSSLPKLHMEVGTEIVGHAGHLYTGRRLVKKTGLKAIKALIDKQKFEWVPRAIGFEDEFLYVYQVKETSLIVTEVQSLFRLLNLEIKRACMSEITLLFANRSHNPLDELEKVTFDFDEMAWFIQSLKNQLSSLGIDFEMTI